MLKILSKLLRFAKILNTNPDIYCIGYIINIRISIMKLI